MLAGEASMSSWGLSLDVRARAECTISSAPIPVAGDTLPGCFVRHDQVRVEPRGVDHDAGTIGDAHRNKFQIQTLAQRLGLGHG
jgi:hypothetical protein